MINRRQFLTATAATVVLGSSPAKALLVAQADAVAGLVGLPGIGGPPLQADDLANRPLLITFWASWCPPCRDEFRHLNRIHAEYAGQGLLVLGVNAFEDWGGLSSPAKRKRFLKQTAPSFRLIESNPDTLRAFGGISRIPTVMLFNADGDLAYQFIHEKDAVKMHVTYDDLRPVLDGLTGG